ncbi:hypothetical protein Ait01nite_010630 [Actinoplanes italicus]|uniref:Ig-like domain-containing protein n=1 Tax=Actinoplanes italicus TaxID=113567 RepID=UPI000D05FA8A|nr:Ig-like domain-containing protein [Actinoplanes italicus]GIE28018.1 hypothetical protein Ait01nite_010630 [Actinoplanes italicus]
MRGRLLGILCLVLAVLLTTVPQNRVEAAITTAFTSRFDVNTNGAVILRGNANLTCTAGADDCDDARDRIPPLAGEAPNNNGHVMVFTDADGDAATFNDSSATVTMPAGSTVLFAGLYWGANTLAPSGGTGPPDATIKGRVLFRTPSAATWNTINSTSTYAIATPGPYQGFADVTSLVSGAGDGVYAVANIQAARGKDRYAGWSLVIAYRNPAEDYRSLRVYDGFGTITATDNRVSIPVTGFETPHSGTVHAEVGAVAYEGDAGKTGDGLALDGQALGNPANNVFDSSAGPGARSPAFTNLFGVDIDQLDANGVLGNAVTSATLTMTTASPGGETYYPGVITIAIDLYAPKIVTTSTATDVNGGVLVPGDEIEYRIAVRNDGNDYADGVILSDAVPVHTAYVPGSLTIAGAPASDAADGDAAELAGGSAVFRLGSIPYQGTTWVTFRVRVALGAPAGHPITNLVNAAYTGRTTSVNVTSSGGAVASTVLQPAAGLAATLTVGPGRVQRPALPQPVSWTATVTNTGPDPEPAARIRLALPAGVTAGPLPSGCTQTGADVTCPVGPLLAGHQASVTVPTQVGATAATTATATLTIAGDGRDTQAADDTAIATLRVNSPPTATGDTATTGHHTPVAVDVRLNDSDPDDPVAGLVVSQATAPAHGTVGVDGNGVVTYTPDTGWTGVDTFTYRLDDGQGGTATGTVTVTTPNAPPIVNDDLSSTSTGVPVSIPVLANDSDLNDGDPLKVVAVGAPPVLEGTVTIAPGDTTLLFTPAPGYTGQTRFTYTAEDSHGGRTSGNVWVDVNNTVPTPADDAFGVAHHTSALFDVLANDTDSDRDLLTLDTVGAPVPAVGVATAETGRIRYTPPYGFRGTVDIPYRVRDTGNATAGAVLTVTVANADPVAPGQTLATGSGQPLTIDVLTGATDPNGDTLQVAGTTVLSAGGTAVIQANGRIRYQPPSTFRGTEWFDYTIDDGHGGTGTGRIAVTVANGLPVARPESVTVQAGIPLAIDVAANDDGDPNGDPVATTVTTPPLHGSVTAGPGRALTYRPAPGYRGADRFDYTLGDGIGTSTATVTIGVINTPPVARPDTAATDTDTAATVDVLANDDDPNGDQVTVTGVAAAGFGTVIRNAGGTLTYTPARGFHGIDTLAYTVEDPAGASGSAVLTVIVRNAPPVAVDDDLTAEPGVPTLLPVLANDHDPNTGQRLVITSLTPAGKGTAAVDPGGAVAYLAPGAATGSDSFTYVVSDDLGRTDTATVTVRLARPGPPAPSPSATAQPSLSPSVSPPISPPPPGRPSASPSRGPSPGPSPTPTPTPPVSAPPTSSPSPTVRPTRTPTPRPTPTGPNRPPLVAGDLAAVSAGENVTFQPTANDSDPDGDPVVLIDVGWPAHGTVRAAGLPVLRGSGAAGSITYTPSPGFSGSDEFTYTVTDGRGGIATGTIVVHVTAEGEGPPPRRPPELPTSGPDSTSVARVGALVVLTGIVLRWSAAPPPKPGRHRRP